MDTRNDRHLLTNRKILRKIDAKLAQQSRFVVLANLLLFSLVVSIGSLYQHYRTIVLMMGFILLSLIAVSLYFSLRFEVVYGAGPARWRGRFVAVQLLIALFVGMFSALVVMLDGLTASSFLCALYVLGYSAVNNVEWSPYHQRNVIRHLAVCVPPMAAFVTLGSVNGGVVAFGLFVVWLMQIRQSRLMYQRHWDSVRTHHELHNKARDLANAVTLANDSSRFKTEFFAHVTHEIRTPMNNVLGVLALLDDTELNEQQRELQRVAVKSGEALLRLLEDMLDYSKISAGQVQLAEAVFNLRRCIDHTVELLGSRAHSKAMELSCLFAEDVPQRVIGDEVRVAQLVSNLVANAIEYSNGTDVLVRVEVNKLSQRRAEFKIIVKDNGEGIDKTLQEHLFDAFSQPDQPGVRSGMSTGLGLAISKGLVRCLNGDIGFLSEPGLGTEFWFTLPLKLSTQQAQKPAGMNYLSDKRALVIGSSGSVGQAVSAQLNFWGLDVETSPLMNLSSSFKSYDLIIVNLPVQQKLDVEGLSEFIKSAGSEAIPVVVLSSLAQRADALGLGIEEQLPIHWLSKPITSEKVQRVLCSLFGTQQHQDEMNDRIEIDQINDLEGLRILLVEDNAVNQLVAKGMLAKLGYAVTCVANGKEALGLLEDNDFDLILMDCVMPVMDGYETTKTCRQLEQGTERHIPIVAMTASVVEGEQQRCLAAGMDDYLSKPVNIEELNAKIRHWLGDQNDQARLGRKLA